MERLTNRDSRLITTLGAFGLLSTRQITALFFPGIRKTTICRRLRTLERADVIRRIRGLPDGGVVWALSRKTSHHVGLEAPVRNVNRNSLEHDVILADVRIALTKAGLGDHWVAEHELRRTAWKEHYQQRTKTEVIPDALLTLKVGGAFRVIALELELRMKSRERYKKIFRNYGTKNAIWMIWYVVPNASMGKRLEALFLKEPEYLRKAGFMWSILPEVLSSITETKLHSSGKKHLLTGVLTP